MKGLFLRLYIAVMCAVLSAGFLTALLLWVSWLPEGNQNLSRLVVPTMRLIADELRASDELDVATRMSASQREAYHLPPEWIEALNIPHFKPPTKARFEVLSSYTRQSTWPLAVLPKSLLKLSDQERARLEQGEVIYLGRKEGHFAYAEINDEEVVEATLFSNNTPLQQVLSGFFLLMRHEQNPTSPLKNVESILLGDERLRKRSLCQSQLSQLEVARLLYGPRAYARLLSTSHLIHSLSFDEKGDAHLMELTLTIGVPIFPPVFWLPIALLLVAFALGITLNPLRQRLFRLAEVTERFGEGDLSARVELKGHGPIELISRRFDLAANRVEQLIKSHESLLQAVSHELRTPISRLYFYNDLMVDEEDPEERALLAASVNVSLEELRALTTELLEFTRLNAGALLNAQERCDLRPLTQSAIAQCCPRREEVSVTFNPPSAPICVYGEARLLVRVALNLISNAERHARSRVKVSVSSDEEGRVALLTVEDDGAGIPQAERERVFEPFVRLDESRVRSQGGTGLGLSIVKTVVIAHEGALTLDESPLGGARFCVTLPLCDPPSPDEVSELEGQNA